VRDIEDSGSATVWVMIAASVMALMGSVAVLIAIGFVEHRRVSAAADLAALAAATRSVDDELVACESAADTAVANGAQLVGCELDNRTVLVVVRIDPPAAWLPAMQVAARAGYEP
jgi:secretion/DNA translocation related TadE-like protein